MSIYKIETRLKLANILKIVIIINIIVYVLFFIISALEYNFEVYEIAKNSDLIITAFAFFIAIAVYQKLRKPENGFWMVIAEILGTIQICGSILIYIILILAFIGGIFTGLASV